MSNCRDLGGYPTKYGKMTNYGVFVRSEAPVELSESDIQFLISYASSLSKVEGIEYFHLPMFGRADAAGFNIDSEDPSKYFSGWGKSYIQWIEIYKGWIKDVFHQLAETDRACQYNCNAGKDRTGIISAFVLSIAGVNLNDIAFDYCISRAMLKPRFPELAKQWGDYLKDKNGKLIAATSGRGLVQISNTGVVESYNKDALAEKKVRLVYRLSDGTIVSSSDKGLTFFDDGEVQYRLSCGEDLGGGTILNLLETRDYLIAGSDGGSHTYYNVI